MIKIAKSETQCQMMRKHRYYGENLERYQCSKRASYIHNDIEMCSRHAALVALEIATGNETPHQTVKRLRMRLLGITILWGMK